MSFRTIFFRAIPFRTMSPRFTAISLLIIVAGLLTIPASATAEEQNVKGAIAAYGAAWAARDVDRIIGLHAEETEFRLFVDGATPAIGKQAVREQIKNVFVSNPSYSSTVSDIQFGPNFVYIRYLMHMDAETPVAFGKYVFAPTGESYSVDAMDYIEFENGLVTRKHTFIDTEAVRTASPSYSEL